MNTHQQTTPSGHGLAKWGSILYIGETTLFIGAVYLWMVLGDFSSEATPAAESDGAFSPLLLAVLALATAVQHVSLLMILWALFVRKYRARWFYAATQVSSVFMLISAGGIILAIVVSRYLHQNRAEFFGGVAKTPPPLPVPGEAAVSAELTSATPVSNTPDLVAVLEENRRLKALVADQALQLSARSERPTA